MYMSLLFSCHVVNFVDIGGIIDNHFSNFLFIIVYLSLVNQFLLF
jgi:hypothetical protein